MSEVSDLLKQLAETFSQAVQQKAEAELALWLVEHRKDLVHAKAPAVLDRLPSVPVRRALPASRKALKAGKRKVGPR